MDLYRLSQGNKNQDLQILGFPQVLHDCTYPPTHPPALLTHPSTYLPTPPPVPPQTQTQTLTHSSSFEPPRSPPPNPPTQTALCLIEWPDCLGSYLPTQRIEVHLTASDENTRRVRVDGVGGGWVDEIVGRLKEVLSE